MATEVEFHTGVADLGHFASRLLRKAYRQGARLVVAAPEPELVELDRRLWTQEALDFIAHVRLPADRRLVQRSPIWLVSDWTAAPVDEVTRRVCVNLGVDMPEAPANVERLIEVVGTGPEAVQAGRERWRRYKAHGLSVVHHNAA